MTQVLPGGKIALTRTSLGQQIISKDRVQEVVSKMGLPIVQGVQFQQINGALNYIINRYLDSQLESKFDQKGRRRIAKMRLCLEEYAAASLDLANSECAPPMLPKEWYGTSIRWFEDFGEAFDKRSSGGPIPNMRVEYFLMPMAALFHVVFALEPKTSPPGVRPETGACSLLISAIRAELRRALISPAKSVYEISESQKRSLDLGELSGEVLRKGLQRALSLRSVDAEQLSGKSNASREMSPALMRWQVEANFLRDIYFRPTE